MIINSATRARTVPAVIESGIVLDVNIDKYTLSVATQFTKKPLNGVSFATPYQHYQNGEGIYFMPEVGSICWICFPSDGSNPFVLAWASITDGRSYKSFKKDLNPGDIYLGTRDENFLILRRGGVVQVGGGPLCQRIFLPVNNTIKDFCENYGLHSLAGDLDWSIARGQDTSDGHRPALFRLKAKEYADNSDYVASLEIGSHEPDSQTILTLNINDSGEEGSSSQISLKMDKQGNVSWEVQQNVTYLVHGLFQVTADNGITLATTNASDVTLSADGNLNASAQTDIIVSSEGLTSITAQEGVTIDGPEVGTLTVGGGQFPVILGSPVMLAWLASHSHLCATPGLPSGPPLLGTSPLVIADSEQQYISKTIFAK